MKGRVLQSQVRGGSLVYCNDPGSTEIKGKNINQSSQDAVESGNFDVGEGASF